jgi:hypothetical protein
MPTAFWTRLVIGLAALLWIALAYVLKVPVDNQWLKYLSTITMMVILLLTAFDLYLWRFLPRKITKRPNLHGTWKAQLNSTWISPETGGPVSKIFYLVIRQTFSRVTVTSLYDTSRSHSMSADIAVHNGTYELSYVYWSAAKTAERGGNAPHRGAASLVVSTEPAIGMEGDYWTERENAKGDIVTLGHSRTVYQTFAKASNGTYAPS